MRIDALLKLTRSYSNLQSNGYTTEDTKFHRNTEKSTSYVSLSLSVSVAFCVSVIIRSRQPDCPKTVKRKKHSKKTFTASCAWRTTSTVFRIRGFASHPHEWFTVSWDLNYACSIKEHNCFSFSIIKSTIQGAGSQISSQVHAIWKRINNATCHCEPEGRSNLIYRRKARFWFPRSAWECQSKLLSSDSIR